MGGRRAADGRLDSITILNTGKHVAFECFSHASPYADSGALDYVIPEGGAPRPSTTRLDYVTVFLGRGMQPSGAPRERDARRSTLREMC